MTYRHVGKKALLFVNYYEIPDNASYAYFREHVSAMLRLPFPTFGVVLPFAALGMALGWRGRLASIPRLGGHGGLGGDRGAGHLERG